MKKRKQWSESSILTAIEGVKNGTAILRAAHEHSVPLSMLNDRHGTKPGSSPYIVAAEEKSCHSF